MQKINCLKTTLIKTLIICVFHYTLLKYTIVVVLDKNKYFEQTNSTLLKHSTLNLKINKKQHN